MKSSTVAVAVALTFALTSALAQPRPQLSWKGYVTGGAVVFVQGERVDAQGRDTGSIGSPQVTLNDALPAVRQTVKIDVLKGQGRVSVAEQPVPDNEYSAVVRIEPSGTQPELYEINFFWDSSAGSTGTRRQELHAPESGEMTWTGTIDDQVVIEIRNGTANARVLRGAPVSAPRADFMTAMPQRAMNVRLEQVGGRGKVELVEQPNRSNKYAAIVRITDEESGAGQYTFRLMWGPGRNAKP